MHLCNRNQGSKLVVFYDNDDLLYAIKDRKGVVKDMAIKAYSVAVSSYIISMRVMGFSSKNSAGFALSTSVLTLLLEKIRPKSKETNNWFEFNNTDYNQQDAKKLQEKSCKLNLSSKLINIQLIVNIAGLVYAFFYGFLQKNLISIASENKLELILDSALITPIVEEVFYRGFLMEWIQVGCDQIDRHIYSTSKESQHHISNFAQAILFGASHMFNENKIENAFIFALTGTLGATQGLWKVIEKGSLLTSIKMHIIQNTLYIFTTSCLIPAVKQVRGRV